MDKEYYSPEEMVSIVTHPGVGIGGEHYYMNEDQFGNVRFSARPGNGKILAYVIDNDTGAKFEILPSKITFGYLVRMYFEINDSFNYTHLNLWNNHMTFDGILSPGIVTRALGLPNRNQELIVLEGSLPGLHRSEWYNPELFNVPVKVMIFNFIYRFCEESKEFMQHMEQTGEFCKPF